MLEIKKKDRRNDYKVKEKLRVKVNKEDLNSCKVFQNIINTNNFALMSTLNLTYRRKKQINELP